MKPPASPPWKKPRPAGAGKSKKLTAAQIAAARERAAGAKRRYPNLVDNLWAARHVPAQGPSEPGILEVLDRQLKPESP